MKHFLFNIKFLLPLWLACLFSLGSMDVLAYGGNGAATNPYTIGTVADWNLFAKNFAKGSVSKTAYVKLTADLDFTGTPMTPIGGYQLSAGALSSSTSYVFGGNFDGSGFKISNISEIAYGTTALGSGGSVGLFGILSSSAVIQNVVLNNEQVPVSSTKLAKTTNMGGICGRSNGATIRNCVVKNSFIYGYGNGNCGVGAICGHQFGGLISDCAVYNTSISSLIEINGGGISGLITSPSTIQNCYADVEMTASTQSGGIAGFVNYTASSLTIIENCYSAGSITIVPIAGAASVIGGLIGQAVHAQVTNCGTSVSLSLDTYNSGNASPQYLGGFVGKDNGNSSFDRCYAAGSITFPSDVEESSSFFNNIDNVNSFEGGYNMTAAPTDTIHCYTRRDMILAKYRRGNTTPSISGTLIGSDTTNTGCMAVVLNTDNGGSTSVWNERKGLAGGYSLPQSVPSVLFQSWVADGSATAADTLAFRNVAPSCGDVDNTIYITNVTQMDSVAKLVASKDAGWSTDKTFIVKNDITDKVTSVIGTVDKPFQGTFKGQGHTINLAISSTAEGVGMIGVASGSAKIENVRVTGSVSGGNDVAGICGKALDNVSISGCANGAAISGTSNVAGLCGLSAATISGCVNVANITGLTNVGGIAGSATSPLSDCSNAGYINGTTAASTAGIVGSTTSAATVSSCLSVGVTSGAAIANGEGAVSASYYDEAMITGTAGSGTPFAMSATQSLSVGSNWVVTAGYYPVPKGLDTTSIGKLAALPFYLASSNKVNAVNAEMAQSTGASWTLSADGILKLDANIYYPIAAGSVTLSATATNGEVRNVPVTVVAPGYYSGGFGNKFSPFLISRKADMEELATRTNVTGHPTQGKYFVLTNNITDPVTGMVGSSANPFEGNFSSQDNNNYSVAANIDYSDRSMWASPAGLFSIVNGATLSRIWVTGSINVPSASVGALCGRAVNSTLSGCGNDASVISSYGAAGGICGDNQGSYFRHLVNVGTVTAKTNAGGICGSVMTTSAFFFDCFNGGMINGASVGGITTIDLNKTSNVNPTIDSCINAGELKGTATDAILYTTNADGNVYVAKSTNYYDRQLSIGGSDKMGMAASTTELTSLSSLAGWTYNANLYPQATTSNISLLASAPLFLATTDSVNKVSHDFTVSTANGVTWKSKQGLLTVSGSKVTRGNKAGVDTLVATLNGQSKLIEVTVSCVWKRDTLGHDSVVCNEFKGKTYTAGTTFQVTDTTVAADPNCDCGRLFTYTVNVRVGKDSTIVGCGSAVVDGKTYTANAEAVDASCNRLHIKIYPAAVKADSSVTLSKNDSVYTYVASNGNKYKVQRDSFLITDSLICVDTIKSKICECDSLVRSVRVTIPTFIKRRILPDVQCNRYIYNKVNGTQVNISTDSLDFNYNNLTVPFVLRDTVKSTGEIREVTINVYKTAFYTDTTEHVGKRCNTESVSSVATGNDYTFSGARYLNDTIFSDTLIDDVTGCPSDVELFKVRLKGISVTDPDSIIGGPNLPGFCDTVIFKNPYNAGALPLVCTDADGKGYDKTLIVKDISEANPCGERMNVIIYVNHSVVKDSVIHGCETASYTDKSGKLLTFARDTTLKEVHKGVVPSCGCDSVWYTHIMVHHVKYDTAAPVSACDVYNFSYLDASRSDLKVKSDTVISDTLKSICKFCAKSKMACDSIIRNSKIHILHSSPNVVKDTVVYCPGSVSAPFGVESVGNDTTYFDTLQNSAGCDSVVKRTIIKSQPVVIDTLVDVCDFVKTTVVNVMGKPVTLTLPPVVDYDNQTSYSKVTKLSFANINPDYCDTIVNVTLRAHNSISRNNYAEHVACDSLLFTRLNGQQVKIYKSQLLRDTLKSKICGCDSIVRSDSFTVNHAYRIGAGSYKPDTVSLFGCSSVTYVRKTNAWNNPLTKELGVRGQDGYTYVAFDTMKSITGCDSIIPIKVQIDHPHNFGRDTQIFVVNIDQSPFMFMDSSYSVPRSGVQYVSIRDYVAKSTVGGCDTVGAAQIHLYGCEVRDTMISRCDKAVFNGLDNVNYGPFYKDTVIYQVVKWKTKECATCDSARYTWRVHIKGVSTPSSLIDTVKLAGCDSILYRRRTTIYEKGDSVTDKFVYKLSYEPNVYRTFRRYAFSNVAGCDSVVPVTVTLNRTIRDTVPLSSCGNIVMTDHNNVNHRFTKDTVWVNRYKGSAICNCDSVVVYKITIRPAKLRDTTFKGCGVAWAPLPDSIYGSYLDLPKSSMRYYAADTDFYMPNVVKCDYSLNVKVKVYPVYHSVVMLDSCVSVKYKGKVYTRDTILVENRKTINACDSVDTIKIHVHPVIRNTVETSGCGFVNWKDTVYATSFVVNDTVRSVTGCHCDSIININKIKVNEHKRGYLTIDSCMYLRYSKMQVIQTDWFYKDSIAESPEKGNIYVPAVGDSTYRESQMFYVYGGKDAVGCDSVISIHLQVDPCYPYPVIINKYNWILTLDKYLSGDSIIAYQWYKDDKLVASGRQSFYTEDKRLNGCYQVVVSAYLDGKNVELRSERICIDTARQITLRYANVYPNPVLIGQSVTVVCNFVVEKGTIEVYNAQGIKVYQKAVSGKEFVLPANSVSGYYFVKLRLEDGSVIVTKFLVQ